MTNNSSQLWMLSTSATHSYQALTITSTSDAALQCSFPAAAAAAVRTSRMFIINANQRPENVKCTCFHHLHRG